MTNCMPKHRLFGLLREELCHEALKPILEKTNKEKEETSYLKINASSSTNRPHLYY